MDAAREKASEGRAAQARSSGQLNPSKPTLRLDNIMKRSLKHSAIAAALILSFGPAMADDADPAPQINASSSSLVMSAARSDTSSSEMEWKGGGELAGEATAAANTVQSTSDNVTANLARSPNKAVIGSEAGNKADGNIGINVAAGSGNLQGNSAAIVSTDATDVFASATTHSKQTTLTNFTINTEASPNEAVMEAALARASGNIGVNISAGAGNAQANQLSMIESNNTRLTRASAVIEQTATSNAATSTGSATPSRSEYRSTDSANSSMIGAGALMHATGNMGVSVATGAGNAQANALSVAVVSTLR
jgi:hypothetical protein